MNARDTEPLRALLCELGTSIRELVVATRTEVGIEPLRVPEGRVAADVLYAIDRAAEAGVLDWFTRRWPSDVPVRLVMEGIEDDECVTFPDAVPVDAVRWVCVVDPVDGTRGWVHDKRPAWVLSALAPARLDGTGLPVARLAEVAVAAITELPIEKQGRTDQLSAARGGGPAGVVAHRTDHAAGTVTALAPRPSREAAFEHGFCSFSHFLPDGRALLAAIEEEFWDRVAPAEGTARQIFEDQYLCSGGQLHDVATGRDRLVVDLRPLVAAYLGARQPLVAHPYDVCTALVLTELGGTFEDPWGAPVDVALDTTSPVAFVACANPRLAARVRPALANAVTAVLGPS